MIIELVNSTCFSCILYEDPVPVKELKPYLYESIKQLMQSMEAR